MTKTDALVAGLCAAWLGALLIISTDAQDHWRAIVASDVTATWAGAAATFLAVWSGFRLARKQQERQAESLRAQERAAISAQLRSAAMLVKGAFTVVHGYLDRSKRSTNPRELAAWSAERDYTAISRAALSGINVAAMPVPAAIDCVMGARGQLSLFQLDLEQYGSGEFDRAEFEKAAHEVEKSLWAQFISLVKLERHYDPAWEPPDHAWTDPNNPPVDFPAWGQTKTPPG